MRDHVIHFLSVRKHSAPVLTQHTAVLNAFRVALKERGAAWAKHWRNGAAARYGSNPETYPVRALRAWLEGAAIESGPVFRAVTRHGKVGVRMSGYAVALVVKRYAGALGLESAAYSGHSLRADVATSAAIAGASERASMNQTGYRSTAYGARTSGREAI